MSICLKSPMGGRFDDMNIFPVGEIGFSEISFYAADGWAGEDFSIDE